MERDRGTRYVQSVKPPQEQPLSRRKFIAKGIGVSLAVAMPIEMAVMARDDLKAVIADPSQVDEVGMKFKRGGRRMLEDLGVGFDTGEVDDAYIREVEEQLGVRLLSTKNAYEIASIQMDGKKDNLEWDHDRVDLLRRCFSVLPDHFRKKDDQNMPLSLTLSHFRPDEPTDVLYAGSYYPGLKDNLIALSYSSFVPQDPMGSLSILTHESVHFMQDSGRSKLQAVVQENVGLSASEFCRFVSQSIMSFEREYPSAAPHVLGRLRYGVENPEEDILSEKRIRDNFVELEAVLGEVYLSGKEVFVDSISPLLGKDIAYMLYRYTKNVPFRQVEYDKYPQI